MVLFPTSVDDELVLLEAWRSGDKAAGSTLFERYFDPLNRFFRSKIPSRTEDAMQKTFLVCVESRDAFEGRSTFRSYVFAVAYNVLRNQIRGLMRERERFDPGVTSAWAVDPSPSGMVAEAQEHQLLLAALRQLPFDQQVVLELFYWEDMQGAEISDVLGIAEGTARSRLRLAKQRLVRILEGMASAPELLERTVSGLDDWARSLRKAVSRPI